jgi:hypothetical protein
MYAHPYGQPNPMGLRQPRIQRPYGLKDAEASPSGLPRIVFVGLGIPKVHQQAVAQIRRDIPVEALDDLRTALLVRPHHVTPVFRVQPPGEAGRVY